MKTKVVCVFNNQEVFDNSVKNNENLNGCELFSYDNREENISITNRYNKFIEENVVESDSDFWCVFIHQDFGFMENVNFVIEKLNKEHIYGPIGAKVFKGLFFGKKGMDRKIKFKTDLTLVLGEILRGDNIDELKKYGRCFFYPTIVDAVDCCCIMIHSSLIKKYNLRFDENLKFHMYAEELCYRAKQKYKIKTKVVPIKCYHLGKGKLDEDYKKSVQYLKDKFKIKKVPSTCPN